MRSAGFRRFSALVNPGGIYMAIAPAWLAASVEYMLEVLPRQLTGPIFRTRAAGLFGLTLLAEK
jgi:hypothetical protein